MKKTHKAAMALAKLMVQCHLKSVSKLPDADWFKLKLEE